MPQYSPRIGQSNSVPTPAFGTALVTEINTDVDNLYTVGMITQAGQTIQRATYLPGCAPVPGQSVLYASDTAGNYVILGGLAGIVEKRIHARAVRTTNQTISFETDTVVQVNSATEDTHSIFDSTNYSLVAPVTGVYVVTASFGFSYGAGGFRRLRILLNGDSQSRQDTLPFTDTQTWLTTATTLIVEKDQYVQAQVYQNRSSSGTLSLQSNSTLGLSMTYLGPA